MDLMDAISEAFPIDWSEFKYHDYFYDEPPWSNEDKIELTIGELHDAIVAGVWKDPIPDNRKRIEGPSISIRGVFIFGIVALALGLFGFAIHCFFKLWR